MMRKCESKCTDQEHNETQRRHKSQHINLPCGEALTQHKFNVTLETHTPINPQDYQNQQKIESRLSDERIVGEYDVEKDALVQVYNELMANRDITMNITSVLRARSTSNSSKRL